MKLETIQKYLKGYFINRTEHTGGRIVEILCKKSNNNDYEVLKAVNTPKGSISAYDNCLNQVNNQILEPSTYIMSLNEILPVINGNAFDDYKIRARQIEKRRALLESVKTEENKHITGSYLVKWKKPKEMVYAFIEKDKLIEFPQLLLSEEDKASAIQIKYPKLVRTALEDNLINQFETVYLEEVTKYECI